MYPPRRLAVWLLGATARPEFCGAFSAVLLFAIYGVNAMPRGLHVSLCTFS